MHLDETVNKFPVTDGMFTVEYYQVSIKSIPKNSVLKKKLGPASYDLAKRWDSVWYLRLGSL